MENLVKIKGIFFPNMTRKDQHIQLHELNLKFVKSSQYNNLGLSYIYMEPFIHWSTCFSMDSYPTLWCDILVRYSSPSVADCRGMSILVHNQYNAFRPVQNDQETNASFTSRSSSLRILKRESFTYKTFEHTINS